MLSIIVPVFNGRKTISELTDRIDRVMTDEGGDWELIFVDDCSTDGSLSLIKLLAEKKSNIGWLTFKENKGQQSAVLCGLRESRGDIVVTMDDDLEHRPELIPVLLAELESAVSLGIDAVYAVPETGGRRGGSLRDLFFSLVLKKPAGLRIGSYRIFTLAAAGSIAEAEQPFVYLSAELFRRGFKAAAITYKPSIDSEPATTPARSRYSFRSRVRLYNRLLLWYSPVLGGLSRLLAAASFSRNSNFTCKNRQYCVADKGGCL